MTNIHIFENRINTKQKNNIDWDDFQNTYFPYIRSIIIGMGLKHHDMEDMSQNILLKAWINIDKFDKNRGSGSIKSWIKVLSKNTIFNHLKKKKIIEIPLNEIDDLNLNKYYKSIISNKNIIEDTEWKSYILDLAWGKIKDQFGVTTQKVFTLLRQGIEASEITNTLDIRENTVYQSKRRVLIKLSKEIKELREL